ALKYLFVALFLALLAASFWIAWTNWRADASQHTGGCVTTWFCRVLIGGQWFQGCLWKLPLPVSGTFEYWVGEMRANAALGFPRALVDAVYLPYLKIIDPLVFLAELSFAVSLLLGVGVRLFALLAVGFSLHLWLGLYLQQQEWPWNYVFLAIIHALFVAHAAGRSLRMDAPLRRRADSKRPVRRVGAPVGCGSFDTTG